MLHKKRVLIILDDDICYISVVIVLFGPLCVLRTETQKNKTVFIPTEIRSTRLSKPAKRFR